jgi:Ferritin-like domain
MSSLIDPHTEVKKSAFTSRREFFKKAIAAGAVGVGYSLFGDTPSALAQGGTISAGDAALLRFASAIETIESDLWQQYNELGGIQDSEVPGGSGNPTYTTKINVLDSDMSQYLHDNTDDEITHEAFLNAYLQSKGAAPSNLEQFRTLPGSKATGASGKLHITNLMQLTVDTSWWTRYRSTDNNPDLDPNFTFPQAVPGLFKGQFTAIPRTDADLAPDAHIQAIANTAGFHFATIEQGGTSLYAGLAQRASNAEVLRVLISIGGTEIMHFQTWQDKAGNAPPLTDPTNGLVFPDLNAPPFGGELFQTNLIMPEPCPFITRALPKCSIIRPTATAGAAMSTATFFIDMGLFIGQPPAFFTALKSLATDADAATRVCT